MKITNPITLDVARSNSYICLLAKQFDENSRFLIATLTNNGKPMIIPAGATVTLRATRPDGEPVAVPGIINNDGTTTVEIDDYILEVVGSASLSIEVAIGDEILTSASFNLTIQRADGNGWLRVYVAAASLAAGNYYITIGDTPYAFTTTQAIPAGGSVYFASEGGTAQTRDASGNVLDASLPVTIASTGTELTSDVPTMSFLTAIAGRIATIEAEMSQKANIDGSYPLLNAGSADNLMTDNGATQAIPFIQEGTGKGNGEATVKAGGILQLKKKLGNTVGENQLAKELTTTNWTTSDGSISSGEAYIQPTSTWKGIGSNYDPGIVVGHKYLVMITGRLAASGTNVTIGTQRFGTVNIGTLTSTSNQLLVGIFEQASADAYTTISFSNRIGVADFYLKDPKIIDLTLWYGSNDRIPSDLLSHPENWGRYYAGSLDYNAGTLESADGTVMRSIGRQIWNENWQYSNTLFGAWCIESVDIIPVSPNSEIYAYCSRVNFASRGLWFAFYDAEGNLLRKERIYGTTFTMPSDAHGIRIGILTTYYGETAYKYDTTLSLYYSGESGYSNYYPYSVLAEVDTGSEVLRSAGAVADEKTPDGTITRRVGVVDLGTLTYTRTGSGLFQTNDLMGLAKPAPTSSTVGNIKSASYTAMDSANITGPDGGTPSPNMVMAISASAIVYLNNTAYTDAAAFKTAMSGVYLYYELATPTTEQGTAFAENIPCDDFGSLMWTQTKGIPQGNEIFYPADLKGALESIVAALPSADGTYTLKATISGGVVTYSWS